MNKLWQTKGRRASSLEDVTDPSQHFASEGLGWQASFVLSSDVIVITPQDDKVWQAKGKRASIPEEKVWQEEKNNSASRTEIMLSIDRFAH
jgi:hypothetical protein